ncbi:glycosyltransferase 87 family protein [Gordonia alkaliphila]|uniref:glycosyltransferase 87 family protein n=1 Tax=Gordonia alkaliphila TaxID=1053547 RepID=UPI001FF5C172|nr:glycosyltransferase 87 family protein [Gordonia alkaliphila]MCK0438340.1 glycosyltransferase 87 family protein [Gordonia alkaliphila]
MPVPRPAGVLAIGAVAFAASLALGLLLGFGHDQIDLDVYRAGAQAWLDDVDLYAAWFPVHHIWLPFTYPPLAAVVFTPFAILPATAAAVAMATLSMASLAGTVWLILTRIRPDLDRMIAVGLMLVALAVAIQLEPVTETLGFGQVNLILMFLVTADLLVERPWWPRGMLIGLAAAVKLTPAAFGLFFLLNRDVRAVATLIGSAAAATAVGFLLAWHDSLEYWFGGVLTGTDRIGTTFFSSNQSWKGVLARLAPDAGAALWLLGATIVVGCAAILMVRLLRAGRAPEAMVVNALAVLLCSPVSWSHHWVWVVPALVLAVDAAVRGPHRAALIAGTTAVTAVFAIGPHWLVPYWRSPQHSPELEWAWWQHLIGDTYSLIAAAVLLAGVAFYRPTVRAAV